MGNGEAKKPTLRAVGAARRRMDLWRDELEQIAAKRKGILYAVDVVKWARNPKSALHECFEWDDHLAAHQHRLYAARKLVASITVEIEGRSESVPWVVSLVHDREQPDGGYRTLVSVLSDKELRKQLLAQALAELAHFQEKYQMLEELSRVFAEIKKLGK